MTKKDKDSIDEIRSMFDDDHEMRLEDLDEYLLAKIIIHYLDQTIFDSNGKPANFTMSQGHIFMEIEDKRFSLSIRDNNKYS